MANKETVCADIDDLVERAVEAGQRISEHRGAGAKPFPQCSVRKWLLIRWSREGSDQALLINAQDVHRKDPIALDEGVAAS
jgi:hypothetical protein